jgi:dihydroorotase
VEKMSHAPAQCFEIKERGYLREGYWADMVLVNLNQQNQVHREDLLYKCAWSPLEGHTFSSCITHTIVSGHLTYANGKFDESRKGQRVQFAR